MDANLMENVKLRMSVIGVGNAGCQACVKLVKDGHNVFVINSSQKDLDDRIVDKAIPSYIIGNCRGAGRNRDTAKIFLKTELEKLFSTEAFSKMIQDSDIIVVVASTAGGTGSGCGPLLVNRIQTMFPNKTAIFFGVLPKFSESAQAQFNALECMKEVSNDKYPMPYMIADLHAYENDPSDVAYDKIATYITDCLNVIRGDYMVESPFGMIDENDLLTIINENGYMVINHIQGIQQKDLEQHTVQSMLIEQIKKGTAARFQKDKVVRKAGIIINTPEQADDPCKAGNYEELEEYIGYPLDVFTNYSICDKPKGNAALIMAGMSKPIDRLSECSQIAEKAAAVLKSRDTGSISDEMESIGFLKDSRKDFAQNKITGASKVQKVDASKIASEIPDIF